MRKLLLATAIATLATAPAFAQVTSHNSSTAPVASQQLAASEPAQRGTSVRAQQRTMAPESRAAVGLSYGYGGQYAYGGSYAGSYAYAPGPYASVGVQAGPFAAQPAEVLPSAPVAVSVDGRYLGADPDPFIRLSLIRDQEQILGTGPN